MKVNKYQDDHLREDHVDIYYRKEEGEIKALFDYLGEHQKILGTIKEVKSWLDIKDIFYIECVDRRCFAYLQQQVYEMEGTLRALEDKLEGQGFIRINKSTLLNVYKVKEIKLARYMHIHAVLDNGECLIINRSYRKNFNERLKEIYEGRNKDEAHR